MNKSRHRSVASRLSRSAIEVDKVDIDERPSDVGTVSREDLCLK